MDLKLYVLFVLVTCRLSITLSQMMTGKFVLVVQGREQCPDSLYVWSDAVVPARSQLECATLCNNFKDCAYHGYHKNEKMCNLYTSTPDRFVKTSGCTLMVKREAFQGSLAPGCIVLQKIVNVTLGTSVVPLPCTNNWIILMNRCDGSVNFTRSWVDYKMGFGDIRKSEFWIGNEIVHLLTSQPGASYRLRVEIQAAMTQKWYYAEYASFALDSEAKKYTLSLSGYFGNAGDSMADISLPSYYYLSGMKFSTFNDDNDLAGYNCAAIQASGWWFNSCSFGCLTCKFSTSNFAWFTLFAEPNYKLQAARLMIRSN